MISIIVLVMMMMQKKVLIKIQIFLNVVIQLASSASVECEA